MSAIDIAINQIKNNNIVALPTDTVYGLSSKIEKSALKKLEDTKHRKANKSFILISADVNHLLTYIATDSLTNKQLETLATPTKRPTTWICPINPKYHWLGGAFNSIAVRLCLHPVIASITTKLDDAITSTSANLSGEIPATSASEISKIFKDSIAYIYSETSIAKNTNVPSTIINLKSGAILRA